MTCRGGDFVSITVGVDLGNNGGLIEQTSEHTLQI